MSEINERREDADLDAIERHMSKPIIAAVARQEVASTLGILLRSIPVLIARVRTAEAERDAAIEERDAMRAVHAEVRDIVQSLAVDGRMDDFAYDEITCPLDGDERLDDDGNPVSSVWLRKHDDEVRAAALASRTVETAEEWEPIRAALSRRTEMVPPGLDMNVIEEIRRAVPTVPEVPDDPA